jgi:hypothetical protein
MKKKVKKFGRGGDILTGLGAGMLGYALYKKLKGEDDDEKKPEAVGGAGRRPRTIEEQIGRKAEEKRREITDYGPKPLKETGTRENPLYKDEEPPPPKPAPKKVVPKAEKPASQTFPRDDDAMNRRRLEGLKKSTTPSPVSTSSDKKGTQSVGEALGMVKPGEAKGTQTLGERISGTIDTAGKSVVRTPQQRIAENARKVEERRKKEREGMKHGGKVKKYASGGSVSSASKRADGIAQRGKTRGRIC